MARCENDVAITHKRLRMDDVMTPEDVNVLDGVVGHDEVVLDVITKYVKVCVQDVS
jgi:hypothetical protein